MSEKQHIKAYYDKIATIDLFPNYAAVRYKVNAAKFSTDPNVVSVNNIAEVVKILPYEELYSIFSNEALSTPVFPFHVAYYSKLSDQTIIAIARKSPDNGFKKFDVLRNGNHISVNLFYPYFYYILHCTVSFENNKHLFKVEDVYTCVSFNSPSDDTKVAIPAISNLYSDGKYCLGGNAPDVRGDKLTFEGLFNVVNILDNSSYNGDLFDNIHMLNNQNISFNNEDSFFNSFLIISRSVTTFRSFLDKIETEIFGKPSRRA